MTLLIATRLGRGDMANNVDLALENLDFNRALGDLKVFAGYAWTYPSPYDDAVKVGQSFATGALPEIIVNELIQATQTVIIVPVPSNYKLPNGSLIRNNGGGIALSGGGQYYAVYDIDSCNGLGYYCHNQHGVNMPVHTYTTLFHELSHVFHTIYPAVGRNSEEQSIDDENVLRGLLGQRLRSKDRYVACCPASGSECQFSDCFVATAALGDRHAPPIDALRLLREHLRQSEFFRLVFDAFFREYYQVSPLIAAEMRRDFGLMAWVRAGIVNPLFEFLASACSSIPALGGHAVPWVLPQDRDPSELQNASEELSKLRRRLRAQTEVPLRSLERSTLDPFRGLVGPGELLTQCVLRRARPPLSYVDWAILEPLEIWYRLTLDEGSFENGIRRDQDTFSRWLAGIQVPHEFRQLPKAVRDEEVRRLESGIFAAPIAKEGLRVALRMSEDGSGSR